MDKVLSKPGFNAYAAITEKIVEAIQQGADDFQMPWHRRGVDLSLPVNAATNRPYHGVNVLALWIAASTEGFVRPHWASYRQWQSVGTQVRAGEKGTVIVFFKQLEQEEHTVEKNPRPRFVGRTSPVFNAAQVENWEAPAVALPESFEPMAEVEAFVAATLATVIHGFDTACYRPNRDLIEMPNREQFFERDGATAAESYYAVRLHELTHWTGAPHRLSREFGKRFGDNAYAFEELVAELGAAFLCAALGLANEPRPDHARYVANWLAALKSDSRAIFTAASQAQRAVEYLTELAKRN